MFLLALWVLFMIGSNKISLVYVIFGVISAAFVAAVSFRLKLIEKRSELLYLSSGFYRHFFKIYAKNILAAIKLIIDLATSKKSLHPTLHKVKIGLNDKFNPALLMASFNFSAGLLSIGIKDYEILVHAIDENYFRRFDLQKICASLNNVNDDNLV